MSNQITTDENTGSISDGTFLVNRFSLKFAAGNILIVR